MITFALCPGLRVSCDTLDEAERLVGLLGMGGAFATVPAGAVLSAAAARTVRALEQRPVATAEALARMADAAGGPGLLDEDAFDFDCR